ncbi:MAG: alpha/beta hydrolase, partial [Leptotrichia sp.]|nr:alpha/beta hydrolase [Leptotrichia sp.]
VMGTPSSQWYKFKKGKAPKVKKFKAIKKVPEILRQWSDYEYGVWTQKNAAPLMILVSGTGSLYNSGLTMYMANVFYDRGYNVIALSSPTTMPYIVSQSKNNYAGYIKDESTHMYELIATAVSREKAEGMKVTKTHIGGYSLGGFQSLLIHELDSEDKKIGIEKSLMLNAPVSILTATQKLDSYLVENGIYNAEGLEKFLDNIFGKLVYDEKIELSDVDFTDVRSAVSKLQLKDSDFEVLTGLLFRFYSANMTFAGEVFSGKDAVGRLSDKKTYKKFDSVTKEFREGLSVSFDEYSKEILYPYLKKNKYPDLTMEQFIKEFDLRNSQEFIEKNNKNIIFITSKDDILITESDLDYINKTFGNKVIIP